MDKLSYALGMSMGQNFMHSGIKEINVSDFAAGVAAIYEGTQPEMSFTEAKRTVEEFFTKLQEEMDKEAEKAAGENKQIGEAFLAENAKREGIKVTSTGLQ